MALTAAGIVQGLRELGLRPGMVVMAHSSLSAFGEVTGGAATVIEALLEAVGPEGTLLMPAMGSAAVFDVTETPSNVGAVTEAFWRRSDVTRSIHPTHSAAGKGPLVDEMLAGHARQPSAIGPDSPWGRVAAHPEGHILFLGCDQDRNTLLHVAEDIVNGPYLNTIQRDYLDAEGRRQTLVMRRFPGPHRDFLRHDRRLQAAGAMAVGKIGPAVCRLMRAGEALPAMVAALREDPAAALCDNPRCEDCVQQRGALKVDRLAREDFVPSAVVDDVFPLGQLDEALWAVRAEGIKVLEVGRVYARTLTDRGAAAVAEFAKEVTLGGCSVAVWPYLAQWSGDNGALVEGLRQAVSQARLVGAKSVKLAPWVPTGRRGEEVPAEVIATLAQLTAVAAELGITLLIENHPAAYWSTPGNCREVLEGVASGSLRLSFNPAHFAQAGEKPFLSAWSRGRLKRHTAQLMVSDGCGRKGWPAFTPPAQGQGEVKELMSVLRCRSFGGLFTLTTGGSRDFGFADTARAFWSCLDTL